MEQEVTVPDIALRDARTGVHAQHSHKVAPICTARISVQLAAWRTVHSGIECAENSLCLVRRPLPALCAADVRYFWRLLLLGGDHGVLTRFARTGLATSSNVTFADEVSGVLGLGFPRLSTISNTVANGT